MSQPKRNGKNEKSTVKRAITDLPVHIFTPSITIQMVSPPTPIKTANPSNCELMDAPLSNIASVQHHSPIFSNPKSSSQQERLICSTPQHQAGLNKLLSFHSKQHGEAQLDECLQHSETHQILRDILVYTRDYINSQMRTSTVAYMTNTYGVDRSVADAILCWMNDAGLVKYASTAPSETTIARMGILLLVAELAKV